MDDDFKFSMCLIKVLCLIVIAMSLYRLAYASEYSYLASNNLHPSNVRFDVETSASTGPVRSAFLGDGQYESPKFWNIGDLVATGASQQSGVLEHESNNAAYNANVASGAAYTAAVAAQAASGKSGLAGNFKDDALLLSARGL